MAQPGAHNQGHGTTRGLAPRGVRTDADSPGDLYVARVVCMDESRVVVGERSTSREIGLAPRGVRTDADSPGDLYVARVVCMDRDLRGCV